MSLTSLFVRSVFGVSIKKKTKGDQRRKRKKKREKVKVKRGWKNGRDETREIIENIIKTNNFSTIKDMGKLMNKIKSDHQGEIDMGLAGKIAKANLSS